MSRAAKLGLAIAVLATVGTFAFAGERWLAARGHISQAEANAARAAGLEDAVRRVSAEIARPEIKIDRTGEQPRWQLAAEVTVLDHLEQLEEAAQHGGAALDGVRIPERLPAGHLPAVVEASGTPDALARFLARVEQSRRALVVPRMRCHVDDKGVIHLDAAIVGYGAGAPAPASDEGTEAEGG